MATKNRKLSDATAAQRRLKNMPYHSERLWTLIREYRGQTEMLYLLSTNRVDLYEKASVYLGSSVEEIRESGWVARQVMVTELSSR